MKEYQKLVNQRHGNRTFQLANRLVVRRIALHGTAACLKSHNSGDLVKNRALVAGFNTPPRLKARDAAML